MGRLNIQSKPISHYTGERLTKRVLKEFEYLPVGSICYNRDRATDNEVVWQKTGERTRKQVYPAPGKAERVRKREYVYVDPVIATVEYDRDYILKRLDEWAGAAARHYAALSEEMTSAEAALQLIAKEYQRGAAATSALVKGRLAAYLKPLLTDERGADEQVADLRSIVLEMLATRARAGVFDYYDWSESPVERNAYLQALGCLADWLLCPFVEKS